jgi:hypothetical protein
MPFTEAEQAIFPGCPQVRAGYMYPNDRPGLGIDLDEREAARYPCPNEPIRWTQTTCPMGPPCDRERAARPEATEPSTRRAPHTGLMVARLVRPWVASRPYDVRPRKAARRSSSAGQRRLLRAVEAHRVESLVEDDALFGEHVDGRRARSGIAVAAEVIGAQPVDGDDDDIVAPMQRRGARTDDLAGLRLATLGGAAGTWGVCSGRARRTASPRADHYPTLVGQTTALTLIRLG